MTTLTRARLGDGPRRPVRMVHLGLGAFFRAHGAWYTQRSAGAGDWGISAYTGRSPKVADLLRPQDGLYALMTLGPGAPTVEVIDVLSEVRGPESGEGWQRDLADPAVTAVTVTVTESGYHLRGQRLDLADPSVEADRLSLSRSGGTARTATPVGRLVSGLVARYRAGGGPLSVISCDNLAANGTRLQGAVADLMAAAALDQDAQAWVRAEVDFPSTVVDRVTPATAAPDRDLARRLSGWDDRAPVVTEAFSEWVLAGRWVAARPPWEVAGARFVDDVSVYQNRKLWLLNAAHSHLAYAGLARGHRTVHEAMSDDRFRPEIEQIWDAACLHLDLPAPELVDYRAKVLERFVNPSIAHRLGQIALDGSLKLGERIVPVIRRHLDGGLGLPAGQLLVLGGWVVHVRRAGRLVEDRAADRLVAALGGPPEAEVRRLLSVLDAHLAEDDEVVEGVSAAAGALAA